MSSVKIPLIILLGPTAVGKTEIAIQLARELNTGIVSCDSRQVYKYMDIGTAKPTIAEQREIPHYLIDVVSPDEKWTVAQYKKETEKIIAKLNNQGKIPLMVGGTGLYIRAVVDGLFPGPEPDYELRESLTKEAEEKGVDYLYEKLKKVDLSAVSKIHPNDLLRIIRALEVYENTGYPISQLQKEKTRKNDYNLLIIGLQRDRAELYNRIERRVDEMIQSGLVKEVENLLQKGYNKNLVSMQGLGYKQIIGYLENEYSLEHAISLLKRDTRRFAKRQLTWFRKDSRINWFHLPDKDILDKTMELIKNTFLCLMFLFVFFSSLYAEEFPQIINLMENGFYSEAKEEVQKVLKKDNPNRFILLGKIFLKEKKMQEAKDNFYQALKLLPDSEEALINLGNIAIEENNPEDLAKIKTDLEKISPVNPLIIEWQYILNRYNEKKKKLKQYEEIESSNEIDRAEFAAILAVELELNLKEEKRPVITDISQHWAKDFIKEVVNKAIMEIYSNHNFIPDKAITRGELAYYFQEVIVRIQNKPELRTKFTDSISPFVDVSPEYIYYNPIMLLTTSGFLSETSPEKFSPQEPVSGKLAIETIQKLRDYLKTK